MSASKSRPKSHCIKVGQKFEQWTVIGEMTRKRMGDREKPCYPCRCECGTERLVQAAKLLNGQAWSCGCRHRKGKYGEGASNKVRLYRTWKGMKRRCYGRNDSDLHYYGDRGIKVCEEWRQSYEAFRDWALANGYQDDLEIDRIDNDGHYCPENCRWVSHAENGRNTRISCSWQAFGETKTMSEWGHDPRCKVSLIALRYRVVVRGWDVERALKTPAMKVTASKVTPAMVKSIRKLYATGKFSREELGKKFGISSGNVWLIVTGRTWKDV